MHERDSREIDNKTSGPALDLDGGSWLHDGDIRTLD